MKDLTGQIFGRLKVDKYVGKNNRNRHIWLCKCGCGKEKIVQGDRLKSGITKSCGCLHKSGNNLKHGHNKMGQGSRVYHSWQSMIQRCNNPKNKAYKNYGGRGIIVSKRWSGKNGFENFLEDMGEPPTNKYQIDRIDNNKGYYKENCRWATSKEQSINKRNNILIPFGDRFLCLKDYCKIKDLNYGTILSRINKLGLPIEEALTTPIRKYKIKENGYA